MFVPIWGLLLAGFGVALAAFCLGFVLATCCSVAGKASEAERRMIHD